jgi:hypothetical protein
MEIYVINTYLIIFIINEELNYTHDNWLSQFT